MTLKIKLLITGLVCLGLGSFIINYQSFKSQKQSMTSAQYHKDLQSLEWVAELAEQKLNQLESSVSYLDKSTVETLKRMGARYFVYAYYSQKDWRLKWKLIGDVGEDQVLSELKDVDFAQLGEDRRTWMSSPSGELIYISPVALAESHQLKDGFLVFGLGSDFFQFLQRRDPNVFMLTSSQRPIYGEPVQPVVSDQEKMERLTQASTSKTVEFQEDSMAVAAYFSAQAQAWIMRSRAIERASFVSSSHFNYFLASFLFAAALFVMLLFTIRWPSQLISSEALAQLRPSRKTKNRVEDISEPSPIINQEDQELVADFAEFLDQVIESEHERLNQLGISLKTQVEEGVQVQLSPRHMQDFLLRLLGNSALVLSEDRDNEKEIQIQVVEQSTSFQLIYLDTRRSHFPSGEPSSLLLQTEGSLTGIDGILSYGSWYFADQLKVARDGFCLSVDLIKPGVQSESSSASIATFQPEPIPVAQPEPNLTQPLALDQSMPHADRVEESGNGPMDSVSFESFALQDLNFSTDESQSEVEPVTVSALSALLADDKGSGDMTIPEQVEQDLKKEAADGNSLVEFSSGDFKIKVRAPRKRDRDVNR
jgi:hypothetical protein